MLSYATRLLHARLVFGLAVVLCVAAMFLPGNHYEAPNLPVWTLWYDAGAALGQAVVGRFDFASQVPAVLLLIATLLLTVAPFLAEPLSKIRPLLWLTRFFFGAPAFFALVVVVGGGPDTGYRWIHDDPAIFLLVLSGLTFALGFVLIPDARDYQPLPHA